MGLNIEQKRHKEAEQNDARLRERDGAGMEGRDSGEKGNRDANDALKGASFPEGGDNYRKEFEKENADRNSREDMSSRESKNS